MDKSIRETFGKDCILKVVAVALIALVFSGLSLPQVYANDIEYVLVTGLLLKELNGTELKQVQASHQVVLENTLTNLLNRPLERPPAVIVEIRDADGFTIFLSWQTVDIVEAGSEGSSGISWLVPSDAETGDQYEMRVFVLSSLIEPSALTHIYTRVIRVG